MDSEKFVAGVAQLIPEGYVDIIRRVTPGATIWVVFHFLTGFPNISSEWLGLAGLIVFLLVSYATGLLLDAVADWGTGGIFTRYAWKEFLTDKSESQRKEMAALKEVLGLDDNEVAWPRCWSEWRMPGLLRTKVTENNARAAVILPKLAAEGLLLRNLAFGLVLLLVIMLIASMAKVPLGSRFYEQHTLPVLVLMGIFVVLATIGALYRARRTVTRTLEWFRSIR